MLTYVRIVENDPEYGALVVKTSKYKKGRNMHVTHEGGKVYYADINEYDAGGETIYAALFPRVPQGTYEIYNPWGPNRKIDVFPGLVAESTLPD